MGTHIFITLSQKSARIVALLAPRTWEQPTDRDGLPATIRFTPAARGGSTAIVSREYAPRLIAQLEAARDFRAVQRIRTALAE